MTFEQLRERAEAMGFKFEWREWVPDGYIEDEDGNDTNRLITKKDTAWKVTFPRDYPRPFTMIEVSTGSEASMGRSLQLSLDEYNKREEIWAEDKKVSEGNVKAVKAWGEMLKKSKEII